MTVLPVLPVRPVPLARASADLDGGILTGLRLAPSRRERAFVVVQATSAAERAAYDRLRHDAFVVDQGLFAGHDRDDADDDPRTLVLVARTADGVVGGVRVHPVLDPDRGWWQGSRLVVAPDARSGTGIGPALVRAACALAEGAGALRFDALVQARHEPLFAGLGWTAHGPADLAGRPHVTMRWPVARISRLAEATKAPLGGLLRGLLGGAGLGGAGYVGDDAAPVPGSDLVAACDAILPDMVERDPEWAGWCSVLVNLNDLFAMGATPVGLLDAIGARDASFARRVLRGLTDAAAAYGVPVLGGHTQLGVPAALAVTALGRTAHPVPAGGARAGEVLRVTADLGGGWRAGHTGSQWDSTTGRTPEQLRGYAAVVPALAPTAAKDVSMAGLVGTAGMLAEASGVRAVLDVAAVPTPAGVSTGDWLTCFPGFAMVTTESRQARPPTEQARPPTEQARPPARTGTGLPAYLATAVCGEVSSGRGVGLRWPDGVVTEAIAEGVTGLGPAGGTDR